MPIPLVQEQPSEQDYVGLMDKLPVSLGESIGTTFSDELFNNAATAKISDYNEKKELEKQEGKELSVDELTQKYDGLGLTWDGPKKEQVAEFIADRQREKIYNQKKIEAGPEGFVASGLRMGAGVAAHIADPTELALTVGTAGLFRVAGAAMFGARAIQSAGLGARLAMGAGEGAVSQIVLEPGEYVFDKEFQRDYEVTEAFKRVAYGAAMGSVLEGTVYGGQKFIEKMKGTKAHAVAQDIALSQVADGKPVDVSPIITAFEKERLPSQAPEGIVDFSGRTKYKYEPFDATKPAGKKVYLGTQSGMESLQGVSKEWRGPEGFTDHPLVANADAAGSFNEVTGNVHEAILSPEARIISTTTPIGPGEKSVVLSALEAAGLENNEMGKAIRALTRDIEAGKLEFESIDDLLKGAKSLSGMDESAVLRAMEAPLSELGFHGFHVPDNVNGMNKFQFFEKALENNGSEGARLFDKSSPLAGDERLINQLSPQEAMDMRKAREEFVSPIDRETQVFAESAEKKGAYTPEEFEKTLDESIGEITQRISSLKDDPEMKQVVDYVETLDAEYAKAEKQQDFLAKAAMKCVGANG